MIIRVFSDIPIPEEPQLEQRATDRFKVFSDIPIPEETPLEQEVDNRFKVLQKAADRFQSLEVGQSFFVPKTTKNQFMPTVRKNAERLGRSFFCVDHIIKDEDGEEECRGVMVWRSAEIKGLLNNRLLWQS